jgi:hypothetical protein
VADLSLAGKGVYVKAALPVRYSLRILQGELCIQTPVPVKHTLRIGAISVLQGRVQGALSPSMGPQARTYAIPYGIEAPLGTVGEMLYCSPT